MNRTKQTETFPEDFLWGCASSAHQYEGNIDNQWSRWEHKHAERLASESKKQYKSLDSWRWAGEQATLRDDYISGAANNHRELYRQDFDLLKSMNLNAWRFGIEWARIEPSEGKWDESALDWYREYIKELQRRGIEPVVTLFHFTLPEWFADIGGFEKRQNIKYFVRYAKKVLPMLDECKVKYIITINEPFVYIAPSYLVGLWPPQGCVRLLKAWRVHKNMVRAHQVIYDHIKLEFSGVRILIAKHVIHFSSAKNGIISRFIAWLGQALQGDYILDAYAPYCYFIGVNYYLSYRIRGVRPVKDVSEPVNDLGWILRPADLEHVLKRTYERYNKPLLITENGLADQTDRYREWWLETTVEAMKQATHDGVELLGYLHWSLLDNFEWDKGFWPRFGLIEVDTATFNRTPRDSAHTYASIVKNSKEI